MKGGAALLEQLGPPVIEHIVATVPPSERDSIRKLRSDSLTSLVVNQETVELADSKRSNQRFIANVAAELLGKYDGPKDDAAVRECCRLAKLVLDESEKIATP